VCVCVHVPSHSLHIRCFIFYLQKEEDNDEWRFFSQRTSREKRIHCVFCGGRNGYNLNDEIVQARVLSQITHHHTETRPFWSLKRLKMFKHRDQLKRPNAVVTKNMDDHGLKIFYNLPVSCKPCKKIKTEKKNMLKDLMTIIMLYKGKLGKTQRKKIKMSEIWKVVAYSWSITLYWHWHFFLWRESMEKKIHLVVLQHATIVNINQPWINWI